MTGHLGRPSFQDTVMAGLGPAIRDFGETGKSWMPGPRPGMTGLLGDECLTDENGLVPVSRNSHPWFMKGGFVYLLTNRPNGTLYVGVTSDLVRRVWEHREGAVEGFTRRYGLKRLVYFERHDEIVLAITREKAIKRWPRAWKVRLVHAANPEWHDLYDEIVG